MRDEIHSPLLVKIGAVVVLLGVGFAVFLIAFLGTIQFVFS